MDMRSKLSGAVAAFVVGLPLALLVIIKGGAALVWVLKHLPQG